MRVEREGALPGLAPGRGKAREKRHALYSEAGTGLTPSKSACTAVNGVRAGAGRRARGCAAYLERDWPRAVVADCAGAVPAPHGEGWHWSTGPDCPGLANCAGCDDSAGRGLLVVRSRWSA